MPRWNAESEEGTRYLEMSRVLRKEGMREKKGQADSFTSVCGLLQKCYLIGLTQVKGH